jgi:hypothetical protein
VEAGDKAKRDPTLLWYWRVQAEALRREAEALLGATVEKP